MDERKYPAWRLTLADPLEDGTIPVELTGTKNHDPTGDAPLLSREGPSYRFSLWSNLDATRTDTHEPIFAPDVLPYLSIPCPICGNKLIIIPPAPRPKKFRSYPASPRDFSRVHVICETCHRASLKRIREKEKAKRKD
ncbi:MAG: hypothetical protein LUG44_05370 [Clostridiales bacterium]|nr:hypothetical protein [Clostridiales bacterium]